MEKRIGAVLIPVKDKQQITRLNQILTRHSAIIIGRQGIPPPHKNISVISLVFEGSTDQIGALTGQLGKLEGIRVKSAMVKDQEITE